MPLPFHWSLRFCFGGPKDLFAARRPDRGPNMVRQQVVTLLILGALIIGVALAAEFWGIRAIDRIVTHGLILLILVLGLQVFMGNSGILPFAHIGFMGVGAY